MCMSAIIGGGLSLLSASKSSRAAKSAANTQAAATDRATELQREMYNTTSNYFRPYREAGEDALGTYTNAVGSSFTESPSYKYRLEQGRDNLEASAAFGSGTYNGNTLSALQKQGQDYGSLEYDTWMNRVGGLMQQGQASAGAQANLGTQFASQAGNNMMQGANALAAGQVGSANAWNSALGDLGGIFAYQNSLQNTQTNPNGGYAPPNFKPTHSGYIA